LKGRNNDLEELTEQHTAGLKAINEQLNIKSVNSGKQQADGGGVEQSI